MPRLSAASLQSLCKTNTKNAKSLLYLRQRLKALTRGGGGGLVFKGMVVVIVVCADGSAGMLMMFVLRLLSVGMVGWVCLGGGVGVCWGCGWLVEWVLDKWHSLYSYTHYKHEYSVLNSIFCPKSGLSECLKNTPWLSKSLILIGPAMFGSTFNLVTRVGLPYCF